MTIHEIITGGLPNKRSKAIAALTLLAIPAAYNAPSLLPLTWLPNSPEQVFLIRLLLSALSALLGTLLVLILVVRAYHAQVIKHLAELEEERTKHKFKISLENSRRLNEPIKYDNRGIV